eukprot:sb/3472297/
MDSVANGKWAVVMDVRTGLWQRVDPDAISLPSICEIYSAPEGFTVGGNAAGARCSFPFYHAGQLQYSCAPTSKGGKPMCGTVSLKEGVKRKWGFCHSRDLYAADDNTVAVVAKVNGNPNTDILSANPTCVPATTLTITKSEPSIVVQQELHVSDTARPIVLSLDMAAM